MKYKNINTKGIKNLPDILEHIYFDEFYRGYSAGFFPKDKFRGEELFGEFLLLIADMNKEKLFSLCESNELKYYSVAMIKNLFLSKGFRQCRDEPRESVDYLEQTTDDEVRNHFNQVECETLLKDIGKHLRKLSLDNEGYWYDEQVFNYYYNEYNNYRDMSKATKIPVSSLYHSVKKTKQRIKKEFKEAYKNIDRNGND